MPQLLLTSSLALILGGCVTPSREKYLDFSGVVTKKDGAPASQIPIRVFPKSDLRSFFAVIGFQDLVPICRLTTDENGVFSGVLSDFYTYTVVAGDSQWQWQGSVQVSRREIKAKTPIKIVIP